LRVDKVFPPPLNVNQNIVAIKDCVEEQTLPALERLIADLEAGTHAAAGQA
jgi:hypothetical protein